MIPAAITDLLPSADALPTQGDLLPLILGVVFLLCGWLLYWTSIQISGALIFGGVGVVLAEVAIDLNPDLSELVILILRVGSLAIGVVLGILAARQVHRVAFFIIGWLVGAVGYFKLMREISKDFSWADNDLLIGFGTPVAGLLLGFIVVRFDRWMIALGSSIVGALLIAGALEDVIPAWATPAIAAVGFGIQFVIVSKLRSEPDRKSS